MIPAGAAQVSEALPEELARLSELTVAAYRAVAPMPDGYAAELADVQGRAADPGAVVLAARLGGRVVGGATVVLAPGSPLAELLEPGDAGLRMLAVDPEVQGAGVGRALVEATIELSRGRGLRRLSLHTHMIFVRARALYEAMGFERTPERDVDAGPELHLLAYVLELE
ncbi:MAG TPA: GNAT family N-acetyltransferase [Candidatus Dormibacteraeota bacterium]